MILTRLDQGRYRYALNSMDFFTAPAKLNLSLHIVGQRNDGYHLIDSIFSLIDLQDFLSVEILRKDKIIVKSNISSLEEDNLVSRAAKLLKEKTGTSLGARIFLEKNIPIGAGLGGGSSDAATTLLSLNWLWKTGLSASDLSALGLSLGADVPFFIQGKNARVQGIGEIITPIKLEKKYYLVVFPNIFISTKKIFQSLDLTVGRTISIMRSADQSARMNDLQETAFLLYPQLEQVSRLVSSFGQPRMTGSGSALFVEVNCIEEYRYIKEQLPKSWQVFYVKTLAEHPLCHLK
jgi:4-(cytidine 5'-diphospho)-2-C-methyl-D-erythritol kinase